MRGAPGEKSDTELVKVATDLEFGTARIPPRPFLRTALKRHRRKWSNMADKAIPHSGNRAAVIRILRKVGVAMVGDTQATIRKGPWAPNAPATIAQKGSAQPLIDTGQLVQSVRAVLETRGIQVAVIG